MITAEEMMVWVRVQTRRKDGSVRYGFVTALRQGGEGSPHVHAGGHD